MTAQNARRELRNAEWEEQCAPSRRFFPQSSPGSKPDMNKLINQSNSSLKKTQPTTTIHYQAFKPPAVLSFTLCDRMDDAGFVKAELFVSPLNEKISPPTPAFYMLLVVPTLGLCRGWNNDDLSLSSDLK